jgi:hypothetical protein
MREREREREREIVVSYTSLENQFSHKSFFTYYLIKLSLFMPEKYSPYYSTTIIKLQDQLFEHFLKHPLNRM